MLSKLTQEEKTQKILTEPVDKLILSLAGPSVLSMLITSVYNMADTFFVSQIGTSASGAVGVTYSLMALVQAFAFMIGQGAGNNISRQLGAGKKELAETYVAVGFFTELIVGTVLGLLCFLFMDKLVFWLGATSTIAPYARAYANWIVLGFPFIMGSFGMNNILRFQGNANLGAVGMMTGGILNMILDPILIFGLGLGTQGAAIATTFSQIVSFLILVFLSNSKDAAISIRLKNFKPSLEIYKNIITIGLPSLARQGIMSVSNIIFNHAAAPYGDACIAAFSIVNRYTGLLFSVVIGIGQGFQPVCGQNIGAGQKDRVLQAYRFLIRCSLYFLLVTAALSFVFANPIIRVFRKDDAEVIRIGTTLLRCHAVTLPLLAFIGSSNMLSQTCGYGRKATVLSCLRNGICLIPLLIVLPAKFGLWGLALSQPVADILSTVIGLWVLRPIIEELKR